MYRMIVYGLLAGLVGLIAGVLVAPSADASGNASPWALPTIGLVTAVFILLGIALAYFLNSRDPNSNQIIDNRSPQNRTSYTTNLLITFGLIIIPNAVLENLFGVWVAVVYCFGVAIVGGAWLYYKKHF
jgi:hypothetical protein